MRERLRLMVITDRRLAGDRDPLEIVRAALAAGATSIQVRDPDATSRELLAQTRAVVPLARRYEALLIVNDRFDIALAAGAHGVHVGAGDIPVAAIRKIVPRGFVIGRSADLETEARQAADEGADYLGVGSVFRTRTKPDAIGEAIGIERLDRVARSVRIPVVGIGGINAANAGEVASTRAAGMAVVSAVMGAEDPGQATRALLRAWP